MTANNDALPHNLLRVAGELRGDNAQELIGLLNEAAAAIRALSADRGEAVAVMEDAGGGAAKPRWLVAGTRPPVGTYLYAATPPSPAESAEGAACVDCLAPVESPCPKCGNDNPPPALENAYPEYVIGLLIAGGYVTQEKVDEARSIALGVSNGPMAAAPSGVSDADVDRGCTGVFEWVKAHNDYAGDPSDTWQMADEEEKTTLRGVVRAALEAAQPQPGRVEGMDA